MPRYKVDALVRLLQSVESRQGEDEVLTEENVIEDLFQPISERVESSDTVEALTFTPSLQMWGKSQPLNVPTECYLATDAEWATGTRTNTVI